MGCAGLNVITWDGKDYAGLEVASGVYFCKLTAAGFSATEKMVTEDRRWWEGDRVLLATMTFRVEDTMTICPLAWKFEKIDEIWSIS
jgi:hypothetical protein